MRLFYLLVICLSATFLQAQQNDAALTKNLFGGKKLHGWEFSLSFSPNLKSTVNPPGLQVETNPMDLPFGLSFGLDTLTISGQERVFQRASPSNYPITPTDVNFRFGAQFRVHRHLGRGFQLAVGLHHDKAKYTTLNGEQEQPIFSVNGEEIFVLYPVSRLEYSNVGVVAHIEYHLWPDRRIHPYFGMGISTLASKQKGEFLGRIYTGEPGVLIPEADPSPVVESTTIDFDFTATGGVLYRIFPRWHLGLTAHSPIGRGSGTFGAQVRYAL